VKSPVQTSEHKELNAQEMQTKLDLTGFGDT